MADVKEMREVTITRACRQAVDNKIQKLKVGDVVTLSLQDASHLIGLRKAVAGKVEIKAKAQVAAAKK